MIWPFRSDEQAKSGAQYDETDHILSWVERTLGEDWYAQADTPHPEDGDQRLERGAVNGHPLELSLQPAGVPLAVSRS